MAATSPAKEPTIADLTKQIDTLRTDIANLTSLMGEVGTAKAMAAKDAAVEKVTELRREGERYAQEAGKMAHDGAEVALDAVRRQPATAVAVAVGIGFLVGLVTSSRR
jgi:ElaB/YqjD/DUF883 family membrane-anchored ribosome-binding protein